MLTVVDKTKINEQQYSEILNDLEIHKQMNLHGQLEYVQYEKELFGVYNVSIFEKYIVLEYALRKKYRDQKYGFSFLNFITEIVGKQYKDVQYILLWISPENQKSMKVARKNAYQLDSYLYEISIMNGELDHLYPFVKTNEFYKRGQKRKLFCQHYNDLRKI